MTRALVTPGAGALPITPSNRQGGVTENPRPATVKPTDVTPSDTAAAQLEPLGTKPPEEATKSARRFTVRPAGGPSPPPKRPSAPPHPRRRHPPRAAR